ncbi:MAG: AMIN domain-containing protein [Terriglobales bacterium]
MIVRLSAAVFCLAICLCAALTFAQQTHARSAQPSAVSAAAATVGNIDVSSRPDGLTITIAVSAPVTPRSARASNPDRLIFDFPGAELKGANRHIPVNQGPVKELRVSLFSVHPAVTRIVVDSSERLDFELKPPGNGTVIVEIPFARTSSVAASTRNSPTPEPEKEPPTPTPQGQSEAQSKADAATPPESQTPSEPKSARRSATAAPGAYALMEKAKALTVDGLQPLETKAQAGDPESETLLALAYYAGVLLKKDDAEATRLLHQAADRGYMAAEESLGMLAETGIGTEQRRPSPAEALEWYHKAAQQGSMDAATDIALMYANGKGIARDPGQAVVWFRRAAEGGDGSARYNLALMYERGEGVPQDFKEAVRWLTAAADQNLVPPLLALAELYLQPPNSTMTVDVSKAIQYYQKAAGLGSATAEVTLGTIYSRGLPGKIDYAQAIEWYKKAADHGDADGEFALGVSYALGHGVAVDYAQARRWLGAAASQGQIEAQYDLAIICEQGNGAPPNRDLASHYYQMAADRGMAKAQYRYGLLLAKGSSGSDRIAAYKWLKLASDSVKESSEALSGVKKSMSAAEITQADQAVTNWRAAHSDKKR